MCYHWFYSLVPDHGFCLWKDFYFLEHLDGYLNLLRFVFIEIEKREIASNLGHHLCFKKV